MQDTWQIAVHDSLNQLSPSICMAKFFDVSLHLQSGHNHSCVHPRTHRIPEQEVIADPHALHNSRYKQGVRQEMLSGGQPRECGYCWNLERAGTVSDRIYFSGPYTDPRTGLIDQVRLHGSQGTYHPRRVEVSFSTTCNFKCTYCGPEISSRWMKDLDRHGPMDLNRVLFTHESIQDNQKMPIPDDAHNVYIDAFWKWLPEIYADLQVLRVTGGEPLLSPHTFRVLDWVEANPKPDLELGINSNLGVPAKLMQRFIQRLQQVAAKQSAAKIVIWTSGESSGAQAEYTRLGLDYAEWLANIRNILEQCPGVDVRIMTTYSVLSMGTYMDFMRDIYDIKSRWPGRVVLDTHTYLQFPKYMAIDILTEDFLPDIQREIEFIENHTQSSEHEKWQSRRCLEYFQHRLSNPWTDLAVWRDDFYRFFQQFDLRSGTDFQATFPRLREFYLACGPQ